MITGLQGAKVICGFGMRRNREVSHLHAGNASSNATRTHDSVAGRASASTRVVHPDALFSP